MLLHEKGHQRDTKMSETSFEPMKSSEINKPKLSSLSFKQRMGGQLHTDGKHSDPPSSSLFRPTQPKKDDESCSANSEKGAPDMKNLVQIKSKNNQVEEGKINVSKEDLIRLLSMLKSELQSKEIALASMKLEQLKRLINPVEINRSHLAKTYIELQDRLEAQESLRKNSNSTKADKSSSYVSSESQRTNRFIDQSVQHKAEMDQDNIESDHESLNMLSTLLELLDRHPLLALPRDSIYCLDYNCNELSTKNYLNLKIQHLDNLIDQHRRFRHYMAERLKRSEQQYLDLTLTLELERNLKMSNERSSYQASGKTVLIKHIDQLNESLEREKESKHAIVMTLLNELLDEREKNDNLTQKMAELERKLAESKPATCKPRVPAKPAQLLDIHHNSVKSANK